MILFSWEFRSIGAHVHSKPGAGGGGGGEEQGANSPAVDNSKLQQECRDGISKFLKK